MATPNRVLEFPSGKGTRSVPRSDSSLDTSLNFFYINFCSIRAFKVEHFLTLYPFAEISILGVFNVHHQLWLSSPYTDHSGELAFNFVIFHDVEQLVQHPTRIPDRFGDTPNILDLFFASNPSAYAVTLSFPITVSFLYLVLFLQSLHRISQSEGASGVLPLPVGGT
ncbi:hypothetical protein E2C01_046935 [Portunus trituberculatus]|uniref:Endonuclease/exonuclease/phosphatase domain-containing protein n=1 Tax=Portunus trituberculatus TaxID=210409 RepID=A0A5B7FZV2_PORTR|nr:hypothetical protein [Portunus trituberculatus]